MCHAGSIRRGKSVCELGKIRQEVLENAVVEAVLKYYQRYDGAEGENLLAEEIRKAVGADDDELQGAEAKFRKKLGGVEATIRRLLDNITPATRSAVERRLKELEAEKKTVEVKIESVKHLAFSKTAVRELVRETRGLLAGLRTALTSGPLGQRQVVLRRCVNIVKIERERNGATVKLVRVPVAGLASILESVVLRGLWNHRRATWSTSTLHVCEPRLPNKSVTTERKAIARTRPQKLPRCDLVGVQSPSPAEA